MSDNRVWIKRAFWPAGFTFVTNLVESNKVLLCVRNPLDVIQSYGCLCNTLNHSAKPDYDFETEYPEWWDWWVKLNVEQIKIYMDICIE